MRYTDAVEDEGNRERGRQERGAMSAKAGSRKRKVETRAIILIYVLWGEKIVRTKPASA